MHPANVSVSAARTGVCWCEQGYNLSSLDQKLTRASAGTIRQTGQADIPFAPRRIGHCEFKLSILASFQAYRGNRSNRPTSCKEQKSNRSGLFRQSQALGNHPREPTLPPNQPSSPVNRTLGLGPSEPPILSCHHEPHWHINPDTSLRYLHRQDTKTLRFIPASRRI